MMRERGSMSTAELPSATVDSQFLISHRQGINQWFLTQVALSLLLTVRYTTTLSSGVSWMRCSRPTNGEDIQIRKACSRDLRLGE